MTKGVLLLLGLPGFVLFFLAAESEGLPGLQSMVLPTLIILVLVLLNGFFVASEFAIIGVRPSQIEQLTLEGNTRAGKVREILDSPPRQDKYIATAQLGITIASLGLGMYGEPSVAGFIEPYLSSMTGNEISTVTLHTIGSIVALSMLTYIHIVVGEMVPKSIALASPVRAVLTITRPMLVFQKMLSWPVRTLNGLGRLLLNLFKIPPAEGHARLHSPEEIELIVTESAEEGLIFTEEETMIRNIFDFSDRQVGQVMTPRTKVQAVPLDMPTEEVLQLVTDSRHSRFPVYEQDLDHIVGILHIKDLVRQQLKQRGMLDLRLILRPAPAVPEDQLVERLLAAFKRQRIHMAIVLDEFGGLAGIVTLEDLVEEIVGEVRDEFDLEVESILEIEPGVIEVAGNYLVDDLNELVFLGEEDELPDVETIGGLIHTWLGRPPQIGDVVSPVENEQVRFTVLDVDRLAIVRARIEFPAEQQQLGEQPEDANDVHKS